MHLDTIKLFCDVVRLRSISRGAAANGVTQSGASQAIQQLEAELDAQLLDRSRRPLQPTAENKSSGIVVHDGEKFRLYTMHPEVYLHVPAR